MHQQAAVRASAGSPLREEDAVARRLHRLGYQHQQRLQQGGGVQWGATEDGSSGFGGVPLSPPVGAGPQPLAAPPSHRDRDGGAAYQPTSSPPPMPVASNVPRAVLRMSRQRGLSVVKPTSSSVEQAVAAQSTRAASTDGPTGEGGVGGAPRPSMAPPSAEAPQSNTLQRPSGMATDEPSAARGASRHGRGEANIDADADIDEDNDSKRLFTLSCKHCGAHVVTKYNVTLHYYIAGVDVDEEMATATAQPPQGKGDEAKKRKLDLESFTHAHEDEQDEASSNRRHAATAGAGPPLLPPPPPKQTEQRSGANGTPTSTATKAEPRQSLPEGGATLPSTPVPPQLSSSSTTPLSLIAASLVSPQPQQVPPRQQHATAGSDSRRLVTKKRRLIFCIAESPASSARPVEQRQASWRILMALHKLHVVASLREFSAMFECFFVDDDASHSEAGGRDKRSPSTTPLEHHQKRRSAVTAAVRDMTRSNAVSVLPALFPVYDQSEVAAPTSEGRPTSLVAGKDEDSRRATSNTAAEKMFLHFARCYDAEGLVWCPVVRLRRIIVQPEDTKGVFAIQPLDVPLPEDLQYIAKLPVLSELHDKFASRRQELLDANHTVLERWRREKEMLAQELTWAEAAVSAMRTTSEDAMRGLEAELREAHLNALEAAIRLRPEEAHQLVGGVSLRQARRERIAQGLPTGSNEWSPLKKTRWHCGGGDSDRGSGNANTNNEAFASPPLMLPLSSRMPQQRGTSATTVVEHNAVTTAQSLLRQPQLFGCAPMLSWAGDATNEDVALPGAAVGIRPSRNRIAVAPMRVDDGHDGDRCHHRGGNQGPIVRVLFE